MARSLYHAPGAYGFKPFQKISAMGEWAMAKMAREKNPLVDRSVVKIKAHWEGNERSEEGNKFWWAGISGETGFFEVPRMRDYEAVLEETTGEKNGADSHCIRFSEQKVKKFVEFQGPNKYKHRPLEEQLRGLISIYHKLVESIGYGDVLAQGKYRDQLQIALKLIKAGIVKDNIQDNQVEKLLQNLCGTCSDPANKDKLLWVTLSSELNGTRNVEEEVVVPEVPLVAPEQMWFKPEGHWFAKLYTAEEVGALKAKGEQEKAARDAAKAVLEEQKAAEELRIARTGLEEAVESIQEYVQLVNGKITKLQTSHDTNSGNIENKNRESYDLTTEIKRIEGELLRIETSGNDTEKKYALPVLERELQKARLDLIGINNEIQDLKIQNAGTQKAINRLTEHVQKKNGAIEKWRDNVVNQEENVNTLQTAAEALRTEHDAPVGNANLQADLEEIPNLKIKKPQVQEGGKPSMLFRQTSVVLVNAFRGISSSKVDSVGGDVKLSPVSPDPEGIDPAGQGKEVELPVLNITGVKRISDSDDDEV
ncbi:MAG: hypothetical protein KGI80_05480 [Verrucomicrobiota bacterium]|nr:hypothetical protein [Verrucomicrobiota bacterium]